MHIAISSLGYLAATLTTLAFIPQALKVIKSRHTKDISLITYIVLNCGILSWLCYGLLIGDLPVTLANGITLIFTLTILTMKLRYG